MPRVFITGAASGIGRDTARLFASAGWQCVLVDHNGPALQAVGDSVNVPQAQIDGVKNAMLGAIRGALAASPIKGRITLSGYEGSELLVGRLLVESGADLRYVGTACPRTPWSDADRQWLEARGVHVQYRASLEQDIAAMHEFQPDLAIGTTPVVQAAKQANTPSLYFTNLISARPLMGPAGAGSLATVINAAMANKTRFDAMRDFFEGVGTEHARGALHQLATPLGHLVGVHVVLVRDLRDRLAIAQGLDGHLGLECR